MRWMGLLCVGCLDLEDLDHDGVPAESDCNDGDPWVGACEEPATPVMVRGELHDCSLDHGRIRCVGDNTQGQLDVPTGGAWSKLAAGAFHTCALSTSGTVSCWGDNRYGQSEPPDLTDVTWIAAGDWASLAEVDGAVVCWGLCLQSR